MYFIVKQSIILIIILKCIVLQDISFEMSFFVFLVFLLYSACKKIWCFKLKKKKKTDP